MPANLLPLDLRCFGPPAIRVAGGEPPPDVLWRKNLALLVYLALSPGRSRSREHLLGLLWPEKEESKARHSLNEAVRRLRAALGAGRLESHRDALTLHETDLRVDALSGEVPAEEFLEGLVIDDAPEFEEWLAGERRRFRRAALDRLLADGEAALAALDFRGARTAGERARSLEPESESAAGLLMRAAALEGDAATALTVFREFTDHLAAEVGEAPGRELVALADRIRQGRWRTHTARPRDPEPPLVGRETVHAEVFAEIPPALTSGPRVVVVWGAAGMGRSRLLREWSERWRLEGGLIASARPLDADRDEAWSTLRQVIRDGLIDAPGLAGTDPAALRTLAGAVPALAARFGTPAAGAGGDLATAFADLLTAVTEETPCALVIDDAHLADDASLGALRAVCDRLADRPVALVLGVLDQPGAAPPALTRLLGDVERHVPGVSVRLAPLRQREIEQLVQLLAPWCTTDEQRDRLSRRIAFETGGEPLLVITLLRGLADVASARADALLWPPPNITLEAPVPFDVPHLVRVVTLARIERLDPAVRQVLIGACVCAPAVSAPTIAAVLEQDQEAVERALADLERRRFVVFDGARYTLEARLIADVVLNDLVTPGQRKRLGDRAARVRAERPSGITRPRP